MKRKTGTREWSDISKNVYVGCRNDCVYCYAKARAIRMKQKTKENWKDMVPNKSHTKKAQLLDGVIMFPTTHDITPETLDKCYDWLVRWYEAGNQILLVTKADRGAMLPLLDAFTRRFKDTSRLEIRVTLGSLDDNVLKFWEPNAPDYASRVAVIEESLRMGIKTSVSMEPFLDGCVVALAETIDEITGGHLDSIWIGKMNDIPRRVIPFLDMSDHRARAYLKLVQNAQTDEAILKTVVDLRGNPRIRWKDSIKEVMERHMIMEWAVPNVPPPSKTGEIVVREAVPEDFGGSP